MKQAFYHNETLSRKYNGYLEDAYYTNYYGQVKGISKFHDVVLLHTAILRCTY